MPLRFLDVDPRVSCTRRAIHMMRPVDTWLAEIVVANAFGIGEPYMLRVGSHASKEFLHARHKLSSLRMIL